MSLACLSTLRCSPQWQRSVKSREWSRVASFTLIAGCSLGLLFETGGSAFLRNVGELLPEFITAEQCSALYSAAPSPLILLRSVPVSIGRPMFATETGLEIQFRGPSGFAIGNTIRETDWLRSWKHSSGDRLASKLETQFRGPSGFAIGNTVQGTEWLRSWKHSSGDRVASQLETQFGRPTGFAVGNTVQGTEWLRDLKVAASHLGV
jgi:hypothetical protein